MEKDSKAHLADAKALLDSRGLYEGQTFHGVNPLLLVEKIIRFVRPIFQQQN
jgi:pre-mRNA-splicing factor 38A